MYTHAHYLKLKLILLTFMVRLTQKNPGK